MTDIELDRIVTLKRAAELMGVSVDTIYRNHRDKIIHMGPRRSGMRMRDALLLENTDEDTSVRRSGLSRGARLVPFP